MPDKSTPSDGNSYYLRVTFKCNWYCNYCSEGTHSRDDITHKQVVDTVSRIPDGAEVTISGGEPGLASRNTLEWALRTLADKRCTIRMNTNGAFFTRYPELCDYVNYFLYHCSEHLQEDIFIPSEIDTDKIDYLLVVTDETMHRLEYYINKYPDILFTVFGASYTQYNDPRVGKSLSKSNGIKIYQRFKDRIHPESYMHLLERCTETFKMQKFREVRG